MREFSYINISYVLFLIWSLIISLISLDPSLALSWWKNYFIGFLMFNYALITFNSEREVKNFIIMIILWGVILAIIIYVILFSLGDIKISVIKLFFTKNLLATSWGKSNYLATFFVL
ncbi:MAG: hypothetical protein QHH13_14675, partial [Melioribacter sp.]|nr:hypothetical protein [Melioribacter sp.]